jgi:hypothetical protein
MSSSTKIFADNLHSWASETLKMAQKSSNFEELGLCMFQIRGPGSAPISIRFAHLDDTEAQMRTRMDIFLYYPGFKTFNIIFSKDKSSDQR